MQEFDRKKFEELILLIARECKDHTFFGATKLNKILFFVILELSLSLESPLLAPSTSHSSTDPCLAYSSQFGMI